MSCTPALIPVDSTAAISYTQRMAIRWAIAFAAVIAAASCGEGADDFPSDVPTSTPPVVARIDPAAGAPGSVITIFGYGFSSTAEFNIVIISGAAVAATAYGLAEAPTATEIESLTAAVPDGAAAGDTSVVVMVHERVSNADIPFTVQ